MPCVDPESEKVRRGGGFLCCSEPRGGMGRLSGLPPIGVALQAQSRGKTSRTTGFITVRVLARQDGAKGKKRLCLHSRFLKAPYSLVL